VGMVLGLTTVSQCHIDAIGLNPALVWRFIAPDDPDVYREFAAKPPKKGFFGRLFGREKPSEIPIPTPDLAPGEGISTDVDKAWQAIHFLLTGTATEGEFPRAFLLVGGWEVPGIEVGYGPARIFRPAEVAAVDRALTDVSTEDLLCRFDGPAMEEADIYPNIWTRDEQTASIEYIQEKYDTLRNFVKTAHERGLGLIITLE